VANCKPGKVTRRFSRKVKKGRVVRAGTHRGTVLPVGSKVKLSVSRGAKHKGHHKSKGAH
jgi:beta-lactam-binding protein with PASTA domain